MRSLALVAALVLSPFQHQAQTAPRRKLFTSPEDGVSFTYPAAWLLNADDDAATAKLRLADLAPPHAVVQLEGHFTGEGPYKDTNFDAGAFAYTIFNSTEETCLSTLDPLAAGPGKPVAIQWRSLPARRLEVTFTVAGTDDLHTIIAAVEPTRCFLFETVLIRKTAGPGVVPLSPAQWATLHAQFNAVLNSVRIAAPTASPSPPKPPSTPKPASP